MPHDFIGRTELLKSSVSFLQDLLFTIFIIQKILFTLGYLTTGGLADSIDVIRGAESGTKVTTELRLERALGTTGKEPQYPLYRGLGGSWI
jgi:hypothetical protein